MHALSISLRRLHQAYNPICLICLTIPGRLCSTGPNAVVNCKHTHNKHGSDFQHCTSCKIYVHCNNNGQFSVRNCSLDKVWDDNLKICTWYSPTCSWDHRKRFFVSDCKYAITYAFLVRLVSLSTTSRVTRRCTDVARTLHGRCTDVARTLQPVQELISPLVLVGQWWIQIHPLKIMYNCRFHEAFVPYEGTFVDV